MLHLLFDLDGTLTDTGDGIIHCGQDTLAYFGLPVPDYRDMHPMVGPPLRDSLTYFGVSDDQMAEAIEVYRQAYLGYGQYEHTPYPGIADLLLQLKQEGYELYVATSKPEVMAVKTLTEMGIAPYFTVICGSTMDGSRTTKAEVLRHLLRSLPAHEPTLMIGDTIYDIEGANEVGLPSVGVAWGYGDGAQMKAAGALDMVADMADLHRFVQRFACAHC